MKKRIAVLIIPILALTACLLCVSASADEAKRPSCKDEGFNTKLCGDVNGDGKINASDIVLLKKYIANYDHDTEKSTIEVSPGADVNGDGTINASDIVLLKKYVANYDYETESSSVLLGHKVTTTLAVKPTCIEDGFTAGSSCSTCGKVLTASEVIPATGHTVVIDAAVTPTCTDDGLTEGSHCSVCSEILVAQTTVTASGHADSDCNHICDICGISTLSVGLRYSVDYYSTTCTITGIGSCQDRHIDIPEYIDGYKVTAIENTAFYACDIDSIKIPKTVTRIGKWAFNFCKLKKVVILGSNATIEYGAFMHCSELEDVVLSDGVSLIGDYVFEYCTSLKNVTIPGSVKAVGYGIFMDCSALEEVIFENGVETIGEWAFQDCTLLSRVVLPESVTIIKKGAFNNCSSLTDLTLPSSIDNIADCTFQQCSSLEEIVIPSGVKNIGEWAFWACDNLKEIVIPESVKSIGELAFYDCPNINIVFYGGSSVMWSNIYIDGYNSRLTSAARYYYSENPPSEADIYWHYDDGKPSIWKLICPICHKECIEIINYVAPTCTEDGCTAGKYCTNCGKVLTVSEVIPALGHTVANDAAVAPTCTKDGLTEGSHCSVCGEILVTQTTVTASGHTEVVDEAVAATCTESGLTEGKHCSVCNKILVAQNTVPASHNYKGTTCLNCKTRRIISNFQWLESYDQTYGGFRLITIVVGEEYQLKYSADITEGLFYDLNNFVFYEPLYVVDTPSIISIDENGKITGLKPGIVGIKNTGSIIAKSNDSDDRRIYIQVVSDLISETEYNDSLETANVIRPGQKIMFSLSRTSDVDMFKFTVPNYDANSYNKVKILFTYHGDYEGAPSGKSRLMYIQILNSEATLTASGSSSYDSAGGTFERTSYINTSTGYIICRFNAGYQSLLPTGYFTIEIVSDS